MDKFFLLINRNPSFILIYLCLFALSHRYCSAAPCQSSDGSIDLSALNNATYPHRVYTDNTTELFYINVCSPISATVAGDACVGHTACYNNEPVGDDNTTAALQVTSDGGADDQHHQVMITYMSSSSQATTVILLRCQPSSSEDRPPVLVSRDTHTRHYVVLWLTHHACARNTIRDHASCVVMLQTGVIDLTPLAIPASVDRDSWEALTGSYTGAAETSAPSGVYYINICGGGVHVNGTTLCGDDADVCMIGADSKRKVLGRTYVRPAFNTTRNAVVLQYQQGDVCDNNNRTIKTLITLQCHTGNLGSSPVLSYISPDGCRYEFVWRTAEACIATTTRSHDTCSVELQQPGMVYNLQGLQSLPDITIASNASAAQYQLSMCRALRSASDSDTNNSAPLKAAISCGSVEHNAAVCWNHTEVLGEISHSSLSYVAGLLVMQYNTKDSNTAAIQPSSSIVLYCDRTAGPNAPALVYADVQHRHNVFLWYSVYACVEPSIECSVTDPQGDQYDLSTLSMSPDEGNWEVSDPSSKRIYHINVCQSLNNVRSTEQCDPRAAVCITDEASDDTQTSLGTISSPPRYISPGQIQLQYKYGDVCDTDTDGTATNKNRTTDITFICKPGALSEGPSESDITTQDCHTSIVWYTEAACPISAAQHIGNCTIRDPNSNYAFNLTTLTTPVGQQPHRVENTNYTINICGSVSSCANADVRYPSICYNNVAVADMTHQQLQYSDDGMLDIRYDKTNYTAQPVLLHFQCTASLTRTPRIIQETSVIESPADDETLMFIVMTASACPPNPVDCMPVSDSDGQQYDLTALALQDRDWVIPGKGSDAGSRFLFNLCRPLNQLNDTHNCPGVGGPIASCMTTNSTYGINMGYIHNPPQVIDEGIITMMYDNGDNCTIGNRTTTWSTYVTITCSPTQDFSATRTSDCQLFVNINSPSACPLTEKHGSDCRVTDPMYGVTYDLSPLTITDTACNIRGSNVTYAVCGQAAGCPDGAGACIGNKNIGGHNSQLTYNNNGELSLVYTRPASDAEHCEGSNYTTKITFTCHFDYLHTCVDQQNMSSVVPQESQCNYYISVATYHACKQTLAQDSVLGANGTRYDLSALVRSTYNYKTTTDNGTVILINVCTTLVRAADEMCPVNASACIITNGDRNKNINIGSISNDVLHVLETGKLSIQYHNGDDCIGTDGAAMKYATNIALQCNRNAHNTEPIFAGIEPSGCVYHLFWETVYACGIDDVPPTVPPAFVQNSCTVTNPNTGSTIDLSSLRKPSDAGGYELHDPSNDEFTYTVNICGTVSCTNRDGVNVASCQSSHLYADAQHITGVGPGTLEYTSTGVTLTYQHGELCHHTQTQRRTIIQFVCPASGDNNNEAFVHETAEGCTYLVTWPTTLVCEQTFECKVRGGSQLYDFTPLINATGYYRIQHNSDTYAINVCGAVKGLQGCDYQGACLVGTNSIQDIGDPTPTWSVYPDARRVTMVYQHTDMHATVITTQVDFICNVTAGKGYPTFSSSVSPHTHNFTWQTYLTCPHTTQPVTTLNFTDTQSGLRYDLTPLCKDTYEVQRGGKYPGQSYHISLCGSSNIGAMYDSLSPCHSAAVCLDTPTRVGETRGSTRNVNYGDAHNHVINMEGRDIKLTYKHYTDDGNKYQSIFLLICDTSPEDTGPTWGYEDSATNYTVFHWHTNSACPQTSSQQHAVPADNTATDTQQAGSSSSSYTVAIVVCVLVSLTLVMVGNVILRNPRRRLALRAKYHKLIGKHSGYETVSYSQLYDDDSATEDIDHVDDIDHADYHHTGGSGGASDRYTERTGLYMGLRSAVATRGSHGTTNSTSWGHGSSHNGATKTANMFPDYKDSDSDDDLLL